VLHVVSRSGLEAAVVGVRDMKVAIFSPYGTLSKESGLLFLVANYLDKSGAEVYQLRCDGALLACGRDRGAGTPRSPFQCARCLNEQRNLATWSGARVRDVSTEIVTADVIKTAEWIQSVSADALLRVEFRGTRLWQVCQGEFLSRWSSSDPATLTAEQEQDLRSLYVSYVRIATASERFIGAVKPTIAFMSSPQDPTTHAFYAQAQRAGVEPVLFGYDPEDESVVIEYPPSGQRYVSKLLLEGIASMRGDPRTWSPEITATIHEILTMMGHAPDRTV